MKNDQFHIPFIKSLVIVAAATIVSMSLAHYFISPKFFSDTKTPSFTSQKSQYSIESRSE